MPRAARIPWKTPTAVLGAGSPEPPASRERPSTWAVPSPITSMSVWPVFMSAAVT